MANAVAVSSEIGGLSLKGTQQIVPSFGSVVFTLRACYSRSMLEDHDQQEAVERARRSLRGLAVGDCLGERFFGPPEAVVRRIEGRQLAKAPWCYTDDTEMALSLFAMLRDQGAVHQDTLARAFADRMDKNRGYGRSAFEILWNIRLGANWLSLSHEAFGGKGSYGNGAAMRVAPLGAYFADDLEKCKEQAQLQSEITHTHSEGIAGAIAVAVAAALVWQEQKAPSAPDAFLRELLAHVPAGSTRDGIERALALPPDCPTHEAAAVLGNGSEITAADTVPFCLWVVSHARKGDYEEAFWTTVSALGDRDTTCAIVGGILGAVMDAPAHWVQSCEPFEP